MKGLYTLKPWYTRRLNGIVNYAVAQHISPDFFTAAGVLAATLPTFAAVRLAGTHRELGWTH